MSVKFVNVSEFVGSIQKEIDDLKEKAIIEVRKAVSVIMMELMSRTPVWSGETVRNYRVGVNSMPAGTLAALGTGYPGDTNKMPLGPEPRRAENQNAALEEARQAVQAFTNLSQTVFITNTISASKWDLVDNGDAPERSAKLSPRYPGVVSILATQSARSMLENFK